MGRLNVTIRNYTSSVPAFRTIAAIEQKSMEANAVGIVKKFDHGEVSSLVFGLEVNGIEMHYELPSQVADVVIIGAGWPTATLLCSSTRCGYMLRLGKEI
jgi:hypothetical protein